MAVTHAISIALYVGIVVLRDARLPNSVGWVCATVAFCALCIVMWKGVVLHTQTNKFWIPLCFFFGMVGAFSSSVGAMGTEYYVYMVGTGLFLSGSLMLQIAYFIGIF
jgi:hypothetical protein